jgi:hypothetical protein
MESRDMFVVIAAPFTGAWIGTYCYFLDIAKTQRSQRLFFKRFLSVFSVFSGALYYRRVSFAQKKPSKYCCGGSIRKYPSGVTYGCSAAGR